MTSDAAETNDMTTRRTMLSTLGRGAATLGLGAVGLALAPGHALARCAMLSLPDEIRRCDFIYEATVVSVGPSVALHVVALWKGVLPASVSVHVSGRGNPFSGARPNEVFLVLTSGAANAQYVNRCGSTGRLSAADADTLREAGLTRRALGS